MTNSTAGAQVEILAQNIGQQFHYRCGSNRQALCTGQAPAKGKSPGFVTGCENAVVTYFSEAGRQNVH